MFDIEKVREQFPILKRSKKEKPLIYFDNGATTQKPQTVIDSISAFYTTSNSNVHRGLYDLSINADKIWTESHKVVAEYINAKPNEVFFVYNASAGLNWVAQTLGENEIKKGDIVVVSALEHHSNFLPWKRICNVTGAIFETLPVRLDMKLDTEYLQFLYRKYGKKVKVVSISHMSNVLGIENNVEEITKIVRKYGGMIVLDGAQSIAHMDIDVKALDCDFFVFSGHKIYGPNGVGVVYGKEEVMSRYNPVWTGGDVITSVSQGNVEYNDIPTRFEVGTPNVSGAQALATALVWFKSLDGRHEYMQEISRYLAETIRTVGRIKVVSPQSSKGICAFEIEGVHPHDIAADLNESGVCIRAGFHCAQPLHEYLKIGPTSRISLGIYNTKEEIDIAVTALKEIVKKYS